jgi:hypothetical protein
VVKTRFFSIWPWIRLAGDWYRDQEGTEASKQTAHFSSFLSLKIDVTHSLLASWVEEGGKIAGIFVTIVTSSCSERIVAVLWLLRASYYKTVFVTLIQTSCSE